MRIDRRLNVLMDSELSVVAAANKVSFVQFHCDVDPSDKRPRL